MGGGPEPENLLIVLPFPEPKEILEELKKEHPYLQITYLDRSSNDGLKHGSVPKELYKEATILVTLTALPETHSDCPNLQLIHLFSAGSDRAVKSRLFKESTIPFTNSSGVHGPQISEWLVMTALVHSHHYNGLYELQKQKKWARMGAHENFHRVRDMVGQRVGILGYGAIGRQVGRVVKAMGSTVLAYTATPKDSPEKRRHTGYIVPGTGDPDGSVPSEWYSGLDKASLHNFLAQSLDWLVVSVPLTPQTRHFLSHEEFSILSERKALVSNIARGPIIDQPALVKALHDGKLRGAALDVTEPEPLPPDNLLWDAPNVIITPHISGAGEAYTERAFAVLEQNLKNREEGRPLINVVSRKKGY